MTIKNGRRAVVSTSVYHTEKAVLVFAVQPFSLCLSSRRDDSENLYPPYIMSSSPPSPVLFLGAAEPFPAGGSTLKSSSSET